MKREGKRDRLGRMAPAREILRGVLDRRGVHREVREHRLLTRWREIVGDRVAARSFPDGLERGVLWVRVASSSWMHQLSFLREDIKEKANRMIGDPPLVRDVRFHLGPRKRTEPDDRLASAARIRRPPARERPLPDPAQGARLEKIEREASGIGDDELRDAIIEARRRLNR